MKPGMVFTVESGIYVKELGGFQHSATVLDTEASMEMLTYYPRDIDCLISNNSKSFIDVGTEMCR